MKFAIGLVWGLALFVVRSTTDPAYLYFSEKVSRAGIAAQAQLNKNHNINRQAKGDYNGR